MLDLSHPLYFPRFIHVGQANFKAWSDTGRKTNLYNLDWSKVEEVKKSHFNNWAEKRGPNTEYPGDLPEVYDEWLKNIIFAIPNHYMDKITDFSQKAYLGWACHYPFDTAIRELCLKPSIAYIEVAFKLIADCPYDKETNYFYRGDDRILIAHTALFKFWSFQTGRGCVEDHADFHRLQAIVERKGPMAASSEHKAVITKFLKSIKRYNKRLNKIYETVNIESPTGPSLGTETS